METKIEDCISNCCSAPLRGESGNYTCSDCKEPCDPQIIETETRLEEYKIEALKEEFDGERTAVHTKYVYSRPESIGQVAREFVKSEKSERFNVWMKVKV
jgi:hypothetical protein